MKTIWITIFLTIFLFGWSGRMKYDVLIRNGNIYDGSGTSHYAGDIGIISDTIAAIGDLKNAVGLTVIDATGLAVAPGFINQPPRPGSVFAIHLL